MVTVDLVGRTENEGDFGTDLSRALQQNERPIRVDGEVHEWIFRGPVVRWLGRGVNDELDIGPVLAENPANRIGIADVDVVVNITFRKRVDQSGLIPGGRGV